MSLRSRIRHVLGFPSTGSRRLETPEDLRLKLDDVVRARARLKRLQHSPKVLAGLAAARRGVFPPPTWREEAAAREKRFVASSPAYAAALEASWPPAHIVPVTANGFSLWVALDPRLPGRAERATRQDIPFHVLIQTREVALGGIMLDIGANIGRTALPRVVLGDVRAVYAAEPEADNYACLVHAVLDNGLRGLVLPDCVAIGSTDGTARLRRSRFVGGHRLYQGADRAGLELVDVPLRRVDSWVATHGIEADAITFVKVDVQGWEPRVLQGAPALLARRIAAWQIEVDVTLLGHAGSSVREIVEVAVPHFTHFADLLPDAPGPRHRPIGELAGGLAYLSKDGTPRTDILLYSVGRS